MPAYSSVSLLAPAVGVEGLLLLMGTGTSPESMAAIANATDLSIPIIAEVVDCTNVGDNWRRRLATLHDMGKISFKIWWVMEEPTHRNSTAIGMRYILINKILRDFQAIYPDGNNSTDAWPAFVTSFAITGKVGGVFEASVELSNSGAPSLV